MTGATQAWLSLAACAAVIGLFSNRYVYFGIAATLALQLAFVYLPPLNRLFHTHPLEATDWIAPIVVALAGLPPITLEKWYWRWQNSHHAHGSTAALPEGEPRR